MTSLNNSQNRRKELTAEILLNAVSESLSNKKEQLHAALDSEKLRPYAWNMCFDWFSDNYIGLLTKCHSNVRSELFDEAAFRLASYLASFGMFRGSSLCLQCSSHIFIQPLRNVFCELSDCAVNFRLGRRGNFIDKYIKLKPEVIFNIGNIFSKELQAEIKNLRKNSLLKNAKK